MKTQLHTVTGKNRFCGPTAIATILGITTDDASRAVRQITGKTQTTGVSHTAMYETLVRLGCRVRCFVADGRPTANQWAKVNRDLYRDKHVILSHGHHYGTFLGNRFICSLSGRQTVPTSAIPKARGRVVAYFVVDSLPEVAPIVQKPVKAPRVQGFVMAHINRLAAQALPSGIDVYVDGDLIWVYPPSNLYDVDPYSDEHYVDTYVEARDRVAAYEKIIYENSAHAKKV